MTKFQWWGFCWSRKPEHILNRFGTRAAKYLIALFWHEESVSLARPAAFWPHTWSTCTYWFSLISRHGIDPYARSPTSIQTRQNQTPRDGEREFWQSPSLIIQNWGENLVRNEIMLRSIRQIWLQLMVWMNVIKASPLSHMTKVLWVIFITHHNYFKKSN